MKLMKAAGVLPPLTSLLGSKTPRGPGEGAGLSDPLEPISSQQLLTGASGGVASPQTPCGDTPAAGGLQSEHETEN
ncbi:hypothetical protein EYF80_042941 [Liparis tanakae]|uniref:Uncharacterized protein n=1 Tax=Liparis tanakae TaxID=230148 RepID=A0A4Z2G2U3_9TELE|nr:hypothetical protein EYF80_042941 [Liparis tanakae]